MSALRQQHVFSVQDYLAGELTASVRHEFVDGQVFAMAGASKRHNEICVNLIEALGPLRAAKRCKSYVSDMKLRAGSCIYYPDIMVICDASDDDAMVKSAPCLIIEVLSESTERTDRTEKLRAYQQLASLQNYLLVAQDVRHVELYRRNGAAWSHESYIEGRILLDCPEGELDVATLYDGVNLTA
jgi:Uma2 family endonuclease